LGAGLVPLGTRYWGVIAIAFKYYLGSGLPKWSFNNTPRAHPTGAKKDEIYSYFYIVCGAGLVPLASNGTRCLGQ